jgi:Domain of unknown function (DUF4232)
MVHGTTGGSGLRTMIWASLVIAAVIVLSLALKPGAARAESEGRSGPAVGVDPANRAQMVFWRAGNGDIVESYRYSHWRGPINVTSRYGLGRTDAAPSIAVADDDQQYLLWRTPSGQIREAHHTDHWDIYRFPSWGRASSAPAVGVDAKTNHQYVFWRGSDGYIHEAYYTGRWHCCEDFRAWGGAASAPTVGVGDDEQQYVFWRTPDGRIREAHHAKRWLPLITFSWQTTSAPAIGVDPVNSHQYVFWRDGRGNVVESWYPHRGRWSHPRTMAGWTSVAGSPSVAVANHDRQYVFWQVPAGHVAEARHTTHWSTYRFLRWVPARGNSTKTPYCAANDLGIHLETTRGAAGSEYRDFGFVNVTSHDCKLYGYPGVSGVTAGGAVVDFKVGHRGSQPEHTVTVAPGSLASFSLATGEVGPSCKTTTKLRFIPPNDYRYEQIRLRLRVCGSRVTVSPVESHPPPL